jgi:hypothetical protein
MDELVDRIVARVGVDRTVAEKSVGIIFDFLSKEGPTEQVHALLDRLPGADAALAAARANDTGGMFGGMGGIMGVGSRLMAAGLGMGQIQGVTHELIAYAREQVGDPAVDEVVAAVPGLGQFI